MVRRLHRLLLVPIHPTFDRRIPMLQDIDLRSLCEVRGNGRDVVSAYFQGKNGLSQLAARERQLADLLSEDDLEAENFERSMATIRQLLEKHPVSDAEGVCFFCSRVLDFAKGYPISMSVPARTALSRTKPGF